MLTEGAFIILATDVTDAISDYMLRMSSDELSEQNAKQLKRNELRLSAFLSREERLQSLSLSAFRKKRKTVEEGVRRLRRLRRMREITFELRERIGKKIDEYVSNDSGLHLIEFILFPSRSFIDEGTRYGYVSTIAESIVTNLNSLANINEETAKELISSACRRLFKQITTHQPHPMAYELLYQLLFVKAVEKGETETFSLLTTAGRDDHPFDPVEIDESRHKAELSKLSDMKEEETLYQMAIRLWEDDETNEFLQIIRDLENNHPGERALHKCVIDG